LSGPQGVSLYEEPAILHVNMNKKPETAIMAGHAAISQGKKAWGFGTDKSISNPVDLSRNLTTF